MSLTELYKCCYVDLASLDLPEDNCFPPCPVSVLS